MFQMQRNCRYTRPSKGSISSLVATIGEFKLDSEDQNRVYLSFKEELKREICLTVSTLTAPRYHSTVTRIPKIGFADLASVICAP